MIGVRKAHSSRTKGAPASTGREENYGSRVTCRGRGSLNALMLYVFIFLANWEPISMERKCLRLRWGEEPWRIWLLFLGKKENLPAVAVRGAQRGMEDYQEAVKTKLSLEKKKKFQVAITQIAWLWDFSWLWRNQRHSVHYEVKAGSSSEVVWWTFNGLLYGYFWDFFS